MQEDFLDQLDLLEIGVLEVLEDQLDLRVLLENQVHQVEGECLVLMDLLDQRVKVETED